MAYVDSSSSAFEGSPVRPKFFKEKNSFADWLLTVSKVLNRQLRKQNRLIAAKSDGGIGRSWGGGSVLCGCLGLPSGASGAWIYELGPKRMWVQPMEHVKESEDYSTSLFTQIIQIGLPERSVENRGYWINLLIYYSLFSSIISLEIIMYVSKLAFGNIGLHIRAKCQIVSGLLARLISSFFGLLKYLWLSFAWLLEHFESRFALVRPNLSVALGFIAFQSILFSLVFSCPIFAMSHLCLFEQISFDFELTKVFIAIFWLPIDAIGQLLNDFIFVFLFLRYFRRSASFCWYNT